MKPLRVRLQEARKRLGIPCEVLERDYLLSWLLAGIEEVDMLRDTIAFKGGTALKKCYFGDYRFSVIIETTMDEMVLKPAVRRSMHHDYGEPLDVQILVYSLEEIVAEKLRAILQHLRSLERRGWVRSRARDYYDLWRILGAHGDHLDVSGFDSFLREKCSLKNVMFSGADSFFPQAMFAMVEKTWKRWLGPLVPNLPPYNTVIGELRPTVTSLLSPK